jgi:hypothetical protein
VGRRRGAAAIPPSRRGGEDYGERRFFIRPLGRRWRRVIKHIGADLVLMGARFPTTRGLGAVRRRTARTLGFPVIAGSSRSWPPRGPRAVEIVVRGRRTEAAACASSFRAVV